MTLSDQNCYEISSPQMEIQNVFTRYAEQLIRLVAPRITGLIKRKLDPEDVVQSALASFVRAYSEQKLMVCNNEDLWALLVTVTLRKCRYHLRRYLTAKRLMTREVYVDTADGFSHCVIDEQPTAEEVSTLVDLLERLFSSTSDQTREIVDWSLQNYTVREIAQKAGLSERSVFRQLERVKGYLRSIDQEQE